MDNGISKVESGNTLNKEKSAKTSNGGVAYIDPKQPSNQNTLKDTKNVKFIKQSENELSSNKSKFVLNVQVTNKLSADETGWNLRYGGRH